MDEIFNLNSMVSRIAIDFIQEELDKHQLDCTYVVDYDHSILIKFNRSLPKLSKVYGEIRIDRIKRNFTVCGYCDGYMLPTTGDWNCVLTYLDQLIDT